MNLFADCRGRQVPSDFRWENEPAHWEFLDDGRLSATSPADCDLFNDPAGVNVRNNVPFLFREFTGDFQVWTRVSVELKEVFDAACLVVRDPAKPAQQWAKLALEYPNYIPTIVSVVTRETSDDANGERLQGANTFLRISRSQDTFAFHYSLSGTHWDFVRYFTLDVGSTVDVGVSVQSPKGNGCHSLFDFLEYEPRTLQDRRSGE